MPEERGIFDSLARMGETALAMAQNRLELFSLELREEKFHLAQALLLAGGASVLALGALGTLTLLILLASPESMRVAVAGGLVLVYLAGAGGAALALRSKLRKWTPFPATVTELKKDRACLASLNNSETAKPNS